MFKKATVVIFDEPTAALNPIAEYNIYKQLDTLVGRKTAICISHRLSNRQFCDHIAVFSEDRISIHDALVRKAGGIY